MSVTEQAVRRPAGTAPERSRAETRRRLLAAGTELFAERGIHGATAAQIARRAGVATGTFYLHFRDKQALFREIAFEALAVLKARTLAAREGQAGSPAQVIRAQARELVAFAEEHGPLVRILFGREHAAADVADEVFADVTANVERGLRQWAAAGHGPPGLDPRLAAQALVAMRVRLVAWWTEDPTRASREALVDTLTLLHPMGRVE
jgi:AcrR family transcriptional regulator